MLRYFPIRIEPEINAVLSYLTLLRWQRESIIADFWIPGDEGHRLRVRFESVHVIRVLDEMWISTEEPQEPQVGHVENHFAYRIESSRFWESQSEPMRSTYTDARHYLFVTGSACLDVISSVQPEIFVVPVDAGGVL